MLQKLDLLWIYFAFDFFFVLNCQFHENYAKEKATRQTFQARLFTGFIKIAGRETILPGVSSAATVGMRPKAVVHWKININ